MKILITQFTFGIVAFDEKKKPIGKVLFPKEPQATAKKIKDMETGKISDEIESLINELQEAGYAHFAFDNAIMAAEAKRKLNIETEVLKTSETEALRAYMEQIATETGFVDNLKELNLWNRNLSIELAKLRVKRAIEKKDLLIGQAIQTLDDLDKTANLFMGRLREWYGLHFPELDRLVEKHETYSRLVLDLSTRSNYSFEALEKEGIPEEKAKKIAEIAEKSMGADIEEQDLAQIQSLSKNVRELYDLRKNMENYVDVSMEKVAPNTRAIAGSLLGARLIGIAGSLQNLALKSASTIQVLGAEKALFRSLKTGARPPKHGLIFQHAALHDAKRWQRGKIARAIAGKLAIAARIDAFGGRYGGDALKKEMDHRIEEIRKKYKEPPPLKEKTRESKWKKSRGQNQQYWREKRGQKRRKKKRARKS